MKSTELNIFPYPENPNAPITQDTTILMKKISMIKKSTKNG